MKKRNYIQARNLLQEAKKKIKDYDSVLGRMSSAPTKKEDEDKKL